MRMTIREIARAIGAADARTDEITALSTDSRDLPEGCLFVALVGERFNGHDYIAKALQAGAAYAIAHERRDYGSDRVLYVADTQTALMQIGGAYRAAHTLHCVGVTGSVGKTTAKEMIAAVLGATYRTLKTEGNLNNEIGLPKTLLRLDATHEAAVIEMGMQGAGEIAALCEIAKPTVGVITNIGVSHIELLGSRENILRAKLELAEALPDGAPLILCGQDDLLRQVRIPRLNQLFYGIEDAGCTLYARGIRESSTETAFTVCYNGRTLAVTIPCIGRHNVLDALAALLVGQTLGVPLAQGADALRGYRPSGMRQRLREWNGCTVVEDCYNASPDSMAAALGTLGSYPNAAKRIAVLGDMLELGALSESAHRRVGELVAENGIDLLLASGPLAGYYVEGARTKGVDARDFSEKAALVQALREALVPGAVIWVKASRGMRFEEILEGLYSEENDKRCKTPQC